MDTDPENASTNAASPMAQFARPHVDGPNFLPSTTASLSFANPMA